MTRHTSPEVDLAIDGVYDVENLVCKAMMSRALRYVAGASESFTSDDIWALLDETHPHIKIRDRRSLGALMRQARAQGAITPTGQHRPSRRRHGAPLTVWRLIA